MATFLSLHLHDLGGNQINFKNISSHFKQKLVFLEILSQNSYFWESTGC